MVFDFDPVDGILQHFVDVVTWQTGPVRVERKGSSDARRCFLKGPQDMNVGAKQVSTEIYILSELSK